MRISRLQGVRQSGTQPLDSADNVHSSVIADGAVSSATLVMHQTNDTTCTKVITCTTTDDHAVVGLYEGLGGSGALAAGATTVNIGGKNAVTNDVIDVLVYGRGFAITRSTDTTGYAATTLTTLVLNSTGYLTNGSDVGAGLQSAFIAFEAQTVTDNTTTAQVVFVKLL